MLIWILFMFVAITICFLATIEKKNKISFLVLQIILICFVSWFAGFRDGLGQDYINYDSWLNRGSDYFPISIFYEPLYSIFAIIVSKTFFSSVFFFFSMASITNYLTIKYFYKFDYAYYIIFIYLLSGFYSGSFNLVRQVCATAIFLYSTKYIEVKIFYKYVLAIFIASSIHLSAIFLLPFYFIASINLSKLSYLFILIFTFLVGWLLKSNIEALIPNVNFYYNYYLERDEISSGNGFFIYLFNITMLFIILGKKSIPNSKLNLIAFNLALVGVVLYNLSGSFYFLFRFAVYFQPFIFIITSMLIYMHNKIITKTLILSIYAFTFIYFITAGKNDPTLVPKKILPLSSIIDQ
jgi:transmembrane protein EpsG